MISGDTAYHMDRYCCDRILMLFRPQIVQITASARPKLRSYLRDPLGRISGLPTHARVGALLDHPPRWLNGHFMMRLAIYGLCAAQSSSSSFTGRRCCDRAAFPTSSATFPGSASALNGEIPGLPGTAMNSVACQLQVTSSKHLLSSKDHDRFCVSVSDVEVLSPATMCLHLLA